MKQTFAYVVVLMTLAGCASTPPPRYYTLDMRSAALPAGPYNLDVLRVHTAEALAHDSIMIQKTPTQVEYYALDQWVGPLGDLVTEKLQTALGARDDTKPTLYITGDLLAFEQVDMPGGAQAHIKLAVQFDSSRRSRDPLFAKVYEKTLPAASASPNAVVKALSDGVDAIAKEIAADAARVTLQEQGVESR